MNPANPFVQSHMHEHSGGSKAALTAYLSQINGAELK
jgi:hypothetical protein